MSSTSLCDLGVFLDTDVGLKMPVNRTVSSCLSVLHQLRSLQLSHPADAFPQPAVSLQFGLDSIDELLPSSSYLRSFCCLQLSSFLIGNARLVFGAATYECVEALLKSLHWFRAPE